MNILQVEEIVLFTIRHVQQEFPHSESRVYVSADDYKAPSILHPVFYGSFDWHSCVHSYWLLLRALKRYPDANFALNIERLFDEQFTAAKFSAEMDFFLEPSQAGFERLYGWAWLLKLAGEMRGASSLQAQHWADNIEPLAKVLASRFLDYLQKLRYPIRTGQHNNTAFALTLFLDYAQSTNNLELQLQIKELVQRMYGVDPPIFTGEPGGEDFLSPSWQHAMLIMRVSPLHVFINWLADFMVGVNFSTILFQPMEVSDASDGRLAHLDGLNLSRSWCMRRIAEQLTPEENIYELLIKASEQHLTASSENISSHYMGEHWLATFLFLALDI